MKIIGYITLTVGLLVYSALLNGWALSKLWVWFIASTFGLPILTLPQAIGFAMVVSYLTFKHDSKDAEKPYWKLMLEQFGYTTFKPLISLGIGAIVKLWM